MEQKVKKDVGEFSRIIILQGIYQEILRIKDFLHRPMAGWFPSVDHENLDNPNPNPDLDLFSGHTPRSKVDTDPKAVFSNWRNAALDCLDTMHWSANSTVAQLSGEEHSTVFHLHISRVVLLSPHEKIRSLAESLASLCPERRSRPGALQTKAEALDAERKVIEWAQRDEVC